MTGELKSVTTTPTLSPLAQKAPAQDAKDSTNVIPIKKILPPLNFITQAKANEYISSVGAGLEIPNILSFKNKLGEKTFSLNADFIGGYKGLNGSSNTFVAQLSEKKGKDLVELPGNTSLKLCAIEKMEIGKPRKIQDEIKYNPHMPGTPAQPAIFSERIGLSAAVGVEASTLLTHSEHPKNPVKVTLFAGMGESNGEIKGLLPTGNLTITKPFGKNFVGVLNANNLNGVPEGKLGFIYRLK